MVNVREAAVVVVGGGIMGCATAYELAKRDNQSFCWKKASSALKHQAEMGAAYVSKSVIRRNFRWP